MNQQQRENILDKMVEINKIVDEKLDFEVQERANTAYYKDFEFKGSSLAARNVYIVKISNQKQRKTADSNIKKDVLPTYEIYNKAGDLIATVTEDGKIHFAEEYLEKLRDIDEAYFEKLNLDDINFELPEELKENDIVMTNEELKEYSERKLEREKDGSESKEKEDKQKDGIDPQSIDGIDIDRADGESMMLEDLKKAIKEKALEQGDISRGEMESFIKSEISKSGLELSKTEIKEITEDIREDVLDESRFPSRQERR